MVDYPPPRDLPLGRATLTMFVLASATYFFWSAVGAVIKWLL